MKPLTTYCFRISFRQRASRIVVKAFSLQAAKAGLGTLPDEEVRATPCTFFEKWLPARKASREEKALWFESMGALLERGSTMAGALQASNRLAKSLRFKGAVGELTHRFSQKGEKIHVAMKSRPDVFTTVEQTLLEAGDRTGELPKVLQELAGVGLSEMKMIRKVIGALAYPGLILLLGVVVLFAVALYLIPEFAKTFSYLGAELPLFTRIVLEAGVWLRTYWIGFFVSLIMVGLLLHKLFTQPAFKQAAQESLFRLPVLGKLYHGMILSRCLKTLSLLLDCGVSYEKSYQLVQRAADQPRYTEFFRRIGKRTLRGERMDRSFLAERVMIGPLGEELSGRIAAGQSIGDPLAILPSLIEDIDDRLARGMDLLPKPLGAIALIGVAFLIALIMAAVFIPNLSLALQLLER